MMRKRVTGGRKLVFYRKVEFPFVPLNNHFKVLNPDMVNRTTQIRIASNFLAH